MRQHMKIILWRGLALTFVGIGGIGLLLPVMPTVPFLIVALWAASKGWPTLEAKLLAHPKYGADIRAWREHRAIRRKAKWVSTLMMAGGYIIMWLLPLPPEWLKVLVGVIMLVVGVWIWRLPEIKSA